LILSQNAIYTVIRTAVLNTIHTANVTQTYAPVPSKFPTVFAREIGHFTPQPTQTLTNAQDVYETTWEVQIFSNLTSGAKEQAYQLMSIVKNALKGLYFLEVAENPIDNANAKYYTLIARFRRVIGSGENSPTIPSA
jgi:hypothetical protein